VHQLHQLLDFKSKQFLLIRRNVRYQLIDNYVAGHQIHYLPDNKDCDYGMAIILHDLHKTYFRLDHATR